MKANVPPALRMLTLFGGARANRYQPTMTAADESGKVRPARVDDWCGPPTVEEWEKHLRGETGLGIMAPDDDGKVLFGVVDVDAYDDSVVDRAKVIDQLYREKLPLLPVRTKSAGLHLLLFAAEAVEPDLMERALRNVAARLGLVLKAAGGKTEIIFKTTVWMPYVGGDDTTRVAVKKRGLHMTAAEFLTAAEKARLSPDAIAKLAEPPAKPNGAADGASYADKRLASYCTELTGMADGDGRNKFLNKALHQMGRMVGAGWIERDTVERELKQTADAIGMDQGKTDGMIGRRNGAIERGTREPPPNIAGGSGAPVIVGWRKISSDEPVWYLTVEGSNGELEIRRIDDITNFRRFADQCAKQLDLYFAPVKASDWANTLTAARSMLVVEDAAEDTTRAGAFAEHLEDFLTNRARGERREDTFAGRPWENQEKQRHEFRMRDLHRHVTQDGMRDATRHECEQWIKALGGGRVSSTPTTVAGKGVRLWFVPSGAVQATPVPEPPPIAEAEI